MAIIYPSLEQIKSLKSQPTKGELHALYVLSGLDDSYEIYFQPYINSFHPDIIVMKKRQGCLIIEVKDWDLNAYEIHNSRTGTLRCKNIKNAIFDNPITQVNKYKTALIKFWIYGYSDLIFENKNAFGTIATAVYFHHAESNDQISKIFNKDNKYCRCYKKSNFTISNIIKLSFPQYRNESLFNNDIYNNLTAFLKPSLHTIEQGEPINFNKKQLSLSKSKAVHQKIRGVAGSGKTLIIGQRAVNAYKRHESEILILTFNITLPNYIHDSLSRVREAFPWSAFTIIHYHEFIRSIANSMGLHLGPGDYDNIDFFQPVSHKIKKFKSVFIDEIQDYQLSWIKILKKYFLAEDSEFVVFGDEKQNIYEIELLEKKPNTTIPGRWSELNVSFRQKGELFLICSDFQKTFFKDKYETSSGATFQQGLDLIPEFVGYHPIHSDVGLGFLTEFILYLIKEYTLNPQDVCVISESIAVLRLLESNIKSNSPYDTCSTFESQKEFEAIERRFPKDNDREREIKGIRRNRKHHFWMNSGELKLSTVHSFKGWETPTLILIIEPNLKASSDELIYTALTRARNNIHVVNLNNKKYHHFFESLSTGVTLDSVPEAKQDDIPIKTLINVESSKSNNKICQSILKSGKRFNIIILGDISTLMAAFQSATHDYLLKHNVPSTAWSLSHWNNKVLVSKGMKGLKKGQSKFDLIITAEIHHHSIKGNTSQNIITELMSDKYVSRIYGCKPNEKLTIDKYIASFDRYLQ